MSDFRESEVRRAADGKFADKPKGTVPAGSAAALKYQAARDIEAAHELTTGCAGCGTEVIFDGDRWTPTDGTAAECAEGRAGRHRPPSPAEPPNPYDPEAIRSAIAGLEPLSVSPNGRLRSYRIDHEEGIRVGKFADGMQRPMRSYGHTDISVRDFEVASTVVAEHRDGYLHRRATLAGLLDQPATAD